MKTNYLFKTFLLVGSILGFMSCEKDEDDATTVCDSDCTVIMGKVVTTDNEPLSKIKMEVNFESSGFLYRLTRRKAAVTSDKNGAYAMKFYLKDDEISEESLSKYYMISYNLRQLDPKKYILPEEMRPGADISSRIVGSILNLKRDTVYKADFYVPQKRYIDVVLKGFDPIQKYDRFEVCTLFPWGLETDGEKLLDVKYNLTNSGYGRFVASKDYQRFTEVPFALNDSAVVRIIKVKNGVEETIDHKIYVTENSPASLTYDY